MKKIISTLMLLLVGSSTYGMYQPSKTFSRLCKTMSFGLASTDLLIKGYDLYKRDETFSALEDADSRVSGLVHNKLNAIGLKNAEKVIIKKGNPALCNVEAAGHNLIVVPVEKHNILLRFACNKIRPGEENLAEQILAATQHEGQHVLHQDVRNMAIAYVAIPVLLHPASRFFARNICKFDPPKSALRMFGRTLGGAQVKGTVGLNLFYAYSRHLEQQADDGVVDVAAFRDDLMGDYNRIPAESQQRGSGLLAMMVDPHHPLLLDRIDRLEERMGMPQEARFKPKALKEQAAKLAQEAKENN